MEPDTDSPSTGDLDGERIDAAASKRTTEAAAEFERAIAAAERVGQSPNVHPRVHEAMIDAMRSELASLRGQMNDS
jgi:hypothetical protein